MAVQRAWLAPVSLALRRMLPRAAPAAASMLIHLVLVGAALGVGLRAAPRLPPVLQAEIVSIEHAPPPVRPLPPAPPPAPASKPRLALSLPRPIEVPVAKPAPVPLDEPPPAPPPPPLVENRLKVESNPREPDPPLPVPAVVAAPATPSTLQARAESPAPAPAPTPLAPAMSATPPSRTSPAPRENTQAGNPGPAAPLPAGVSMLSNTTSAPTRAPALDGSTAGPPGSPAPPAAPPPPAAVAAAPGGEVAAPAARTGVTRSAIPRGGYQVQPSYPATARRLGIQGTTILRVHVAADGRVSEVAVERSAGFPDLDQAAADAVRRWRFEPGRRGEEPVSMWVLLPVHFRLK